MGGNRSDKAHADAGPTKSTHARARHRSNRWQQAGSAIPGHRVSKNWIRRRAPDAAVVVAVAAVETKHGHRRIALHLT